MSSGDFNLLHLRNLKMYKPDGSFPGVSSIFTIGSNGVPVYTNDIALRDTVASTLTVSTITASTATFSTLNTSAQLGFSTMIGSSIVASTATVSTLGVTSQLGVSSLLASTISTNLLTTPDIQLLSSAIALGLSTTSTQANFSGGSYSAGSWVLAKSGVATARKLAVSATGQYQMVVSGATADLWISSDSGATWTGLGASQGLPTLTGSAYWSSGSISASGQHILLGVYGGSLWISSDYGRTFALTEQPTPDIWLQLNGSTVDTMGASTVTATGSPSYAPVQRPGYSAQAVNLANPAGGTATRYVRGTWTGATNFTVSFWFNAQTLAGYQYLFSTYYTFVVALNPSGQIYVYTNSPSGLGILLNTSFSVSINTWYYVTASFVSNGNGSLYINNTLIGTFACASSPSANIFNGLYALGTSDYIDSNAFNGYIADLRIHNSAIPYVPIPLLAPNVWLPFESSTVDSGSQSANQTSSTIYLPFEGSVADQMGVSTVSALGAVAPSYVAANRAGYNGSAIVLANTAGGNAALGTYVRGSWAGSDNFTVSFWVNFQSLSQDQVIFSGIDTGIHLILFSTNYLYCYLPSGTGLNRISLNTSYTLSSNTWYYITIIFQSNGTCSLYVNNSLAQSTSNSGGWGSFTGNQFSLGTYDNSTTNAFNGYIDDLRIYNYAITYRPVSIMTVTGSLSYVPGVIGLNAVSLANTAGGTPNNYIMANYSSGNRFTVSLWFNPQTFPATVGGVTKLFGFGTNADTNFSFNIEQTSRLYLALYQSGAIVTTYDIAKLSLSTWYHLYAIYQEGGVSSVYLNGVQVVSYTGPTLNSTNTKFSIGVTTQVVVQAFNGYIDDLRIYNAAIPYHALVPQNYRSVALSGTGQYALASCSPSGWVLGSADSMTNWTKQAVCVGTQSDLIQPNKTGLASNQWEQAGVNYVATASSTNNASVWPIYGAFNNSSSNQWNSGNRYATNGSYTGSVSTTILGGVGSQTGEWIQLQASVPMVLQSFSIMAGGWWQTPKTYYLVGSMDGSSWYPLQFGTFASNPYNTNQAVATNNLLINFTGTQSYTANTTVNVTTTAYTTSTTPYLYFRMIAPTVFADASAGDWSIGELYLNFARPSPSQLALNYSGQYQLVATNSAAGNVMPNQTGLVTSTWTQSGVQWGAQASSVYENLDVLSERNAFNNTTASTWASFNPSYDTGGTYTRSISTTIQGVGSVSGEWIQIKASVPLVLQSYLYGCGNFRSIPKTQYIVGSMDGSTWYPLQYLSYTVNPFTISGAISTTYITLNNTGAITVQGDVEGRGTSTAYSYTTQPWMYFRFVGTSIWPSSGNYPMEYSELYLNFQNSSSYSTNYGSTWLNTSRTISNEIVSLSPSGQYALSTNCVPPLARLTMDNTNVDAQGVLVPTTGAGSVFYSTSVVKVGTHSVGFSNVAGAAPGVYLNYTVPSVLFKPISITISCWVYPTSITSDSCAWMFTNSSLVTAGPNLYFSSTGQIFANVHSVNGNIQLTGGTQNPIITNRWTHFAVTFSGNTGVLYMNGVQIGSNNTVAGPLSIQGGGDIGNLLVGTGFSNLLAFAGYVDDVRIYTQALSADEVNALYKNPALTQSVGVSNSYLPITSYVKPVLPGANANVVDAKVSQTGQYMVAVTSGSVNNVFYSTDSGATFSALTIGASPMTACTMSADGSYLTVSNVLGAVYTLNKNSVGYTVAVGSSAGAVNQGANSIAIGNGAGAVNQSANSIVLNASGSALGTGAAGFYVSPIATTAGLPMDLLGYGSDSQVVKTGVVVLPGGNVGVGLSSLPTYNTRNYRLYIDQVFGRDDSGIYISNGNYGSDQGLSISMVNAGGGYFYSYAKLQGKTSGVSAATPIVLQSEGGSVGIGTTNPSGLLTTYSASTYQTVGMTILNGSVANAGYQLNVSGSAGWGTGGTFGIYNILAGGFSMVISPAGNVGIGTTNPSYKLSLQNGDFSIITNYAGYQATGTIGQMIRFQRSVHPTLTDIIYGDTARIYTLRDYGQQIPGGDTLVLTTRQPSWGTETWNAGLCINSSGSVGIGATNPGYQLQLSIDSAAKPGTNTWTIASDARLKTSIQLADTARCYDIIKTVPLKRYSWREDVYSLEQVKDRSKLGWIAQDVEAVFPKAVGTYRFAYNQKYEDVLKEDGTTEKKLISEDVIEDCKDLNADQMYAVMYGAVQKLIQTNEEKDTLIASLQTQLSSLLAWAQAQGFSPSA